MFKDNAPEVPSPPPKPPSTRVRKAALMRGDRNRLMLGTYKDIPSCPGYSINQYGMVKSKGRYIYFPGDHAPVWLKESLLSPCLIRNQYWAVNLSLKGVPRRYYVHRLQAEAHLGPCPEGHKLKVDPNYLQDRLLVYLSYVPTCRQIAVMKREAKAAGKAPPRKKRNLPYMTLADQIIAANQAGSRTGTEDETESGSPNPTKEV